jgi:hypothetical protein
MNGGSILYKNYSHIRMQCNITRPTANALSWDHFCLWSEKGQELLELVDGATLSPSFRSEKIT